MPAPSRPPDSTAREGPPVRLLALATALPPHVLTQEAVIAQAEAILAPRFAGFERLAPAFRNAGIRQRHSVVPMDWFTAPHGWVDRSAAYLAGATDLFCEAAGAALAQAGLTAAEVDVIVTISSTGVATPTLEAQAARRMGFRADAIRVPVFGLGCAGGVSGLGLARDLAAARPGGLVLMVAVETCTLMFRMDRLEKADIIATALFGDGAAAVLLRAGAGDGPVVGPVAQHMWPDTLAVMGWTVEETGLGVVFDRSIPVFAEAHLAEATDRLVGMLGREPAIARFVCHPGGAKVVEAIETALELPAGSLDAERAVLEDCGNMSAPTVLFVLERLLAAGISGRLVLMALGPGFTLAALPLEVGP